MFDEDGIVLIMEPADEKKLEEIYFFSAKVSV